MSNPKIDSPEPIYIASMVRRHIDMSGVVEILHKRMDDAETPSEMELLHLTFHQDRPARLRRNYPGRIEDLARAYYAFFGSVDGLPYTIRDGDRIFDVSYDSDFLESLAHFKDTKDYALSQLLTLLNDNPMICVVSSIELLRRCFDAEDDYLDGCGSLKRLQRHFSDIISTRRALPCPLQCIAFQVAEWVRDEYPNDAEAWQKWVPFFEDSQSPKQSVWAQLNPSWVEALPTEYLDHISEIVRRAKRRFFTEFNRQCKDEPGLLSRYGSTLHELVQAYIEKHGGSRS